MIKYIKIKARGQQFHINEEIFDKQLTLVYSRNGTGKSVFTDVMKAASGEEVNIDDILNEQISNIDELSKNLSGRKLSIFNAYLFDERNVIFNEKIIISENGK